MEEGKCGDDGPAFPSLLDEGAKYVEGMSLRDWFAGLSLLGQRANGRFGPIMHEAAYEDADAMLKVRNT